MGEVGETSQYPSSVESVKPVDVKTSAEQAKEALYEMSSAKRVGHYLGAGKDLIKEKLDQGLFAGDDEKELREKAEYALKYTGEKGDTENSKSLRAIFETLEVAGEDGKEISQAASENLFVKVGNGENARNLTLDEWRAELEAAKKPADGTSPDSQKIQELENGVFGYSFPKNSTRDESESTPKEKSQEDISITEYRKSFEEKFKLAKARGDTPKEQMEQIEQTLILLRLAEEANGDAGVIFKHEALKNLAEEHGAQGLNNVIDTLQEKVPAAIEEVCGLMDPDKAEEFRNAIEEGKLGDLIKEGKLLKVEGLRQLFFGKEFTEEKLREILNKKRKWKDPLLLALIILLIGPVTLGQETFKTR